MYIYTYSPDRVNSTVPLKHSLHLANSNDGEVQDMCLHLCLSRVYLEHQQSKLIYLYLNNAASADTQLKPRSH